jgi:beta-lactamase superfamily II metal-dependent hydrolase
MAAKKKAAANGKIRIRMYRVGFGDCFLVSIPDGDSSKHILVDCGVHSQGNIGTMKDCIADIATETGGKLAVVIATHAHQDHISGFGAFGDQFAKFDIGEVWMPWLMNPNDAKAKKIDKKQTALASALRSHFAATGDADPYVEHIIVNALGTTKLGAAGGNTGNAPALKLLRGGFKNATVRYFKAGDEVAKAAGVNGLTAQILSPSTDESFLGKMDPPIAQRYKVSDDDAGTANAIKPFADYWTMARAKFPSGFEGLPGAEERSLALHLEMPMSALALALDKVLNNTSLVVLFQYGEEALLFPGDAQWGNWQSWIEKDGTDVLSNVTFYKVAHHGSVNATPKSALEAMKQKKFAAMASTQSKPWPSIPAPKLVKALNTQTGNQYVQSDSIKVSKAPFKRIAKVPSKFKKGDLWYDYFA